jgi:hypothetical protein
MNQVKVKCAIQPGVPTRNNRVYDEKSLEVILSDCLNCAVTTEVDLETFSSPLDKAIGIISSWSKENSQYYFTISFMEDNAKKLGLPIDSDQLEIVPIVTVVTTSKSNIFHVTEDMKCRAHLFTIRKKIDAKLEDLNDIEKTYVKYVKNDSEEMSSD